MTRIWRQRLRGFTLIELMIVLTLVGILATLAVPSMRTLISNQALSNSASDFLSSVIQARSAALKANRRVIMQPASGTDWRTGWTIYVDVNEDGAYDSAVDTLLLTREALPTDVSIITPTGTGDAANISLIGFGADGFLDIVSGNRNGSVYMQSTLTARKKIIAVSRVGRARICDPYLTPGCEPS